MFEGMLIVDVIRGKDSTGVAIIKRHSHDIVKKVGVPHELFDSIKYQNAMKGVNQILIGHNRFATTGKVNALNAHPFETENLIGVHNGTLENKYVFDKNSNYGTDSEALYNAIDEQGVKEAIGKASGAYALIWYDKQAKTLNFLRNDQRPLFIASNKGNTTIFGASELWMVHAIAQREGMEIDKVEALPIDKHFIFDMPVKDTDAFSKPKVMDVKCATPLAQFKQTYPTPTVTTGTTSSYAASLLYKYVKGIAASSVVIEGNTQYLEYKCKEHLLNTFRVYFPSYLKAQEQVGKEATLYTRYLVSANGHAKYISCDIIPENDEELLESTGKVNHEGDAITKEDFKELYKDCAWCADPLQFEDDWVISSKGVCVCSSCRKEPDVKTYLGLSHVTQ